MSAAADKAPSALVLRCCAMLEALCGAVPHGLGNKELAAVLLTSPPNVTRAADVLAAQGWVQKLPSGRWAVTSRFTRLTFAVAAAFEREEQRAAERRRNFTLSN